MGVGCNARFQITKTQEKKEISEETREDDLLVNVDQELIVRLKS